jgi:hypothetical protein
MLRTVWAVVREGKIELLENLSLSEGARVLVTLMPDEDEHLRLEQNLAGCSENRTLISALTSIKKAIA